MKTNFYGEIFGVYNNESKNDALSGFYLIINAFLPTNIHSCINIYEIITKLKLEHSYKDQDQEFFVQSPNNLMNLSKINHAFLSHSSIINPSFCKITGVIIKENYYSIDENKMCDIKRRFSLPFSAKTISPGKSREFKLRLEKIDGFFLNIFKLIKIFCCFLKIYSVSTPLINLRNENITAENPKESENNEDDPKNFDWDKKNILENEENKDKNEKDSDEIEVENENEENEDKKEKENLNAYRENIYLKKNNLDIIEENIDKKGESLVEIPENLNIIEKNAYKIEQNLENQDSNLNKNGENVYIEGEKEQDFTQKETLSSNKIEGNALPALILDSKKSESSEKGKINYFHFENLKVVTSITDFEKDKTPTKHDFISKKTSLENMDLLNFPNVSKRKSLFLHEIPKSPKANQLLEIKEMNINSMDLDESQNITSNYPRSNGFY